MFRSHAHRVNNDKSRHGKGYRYGNSDGPRARHGRSRVALARRASQGSKVPVRVWSGSRSACRSGCVPRQKPSQKVCGGLVLTYLSLLLMTPLYLLAGSHAAKTGAG